MSNVKKICQFLLTMEEDPASETMCLYLCFKRWDVTEAKN